MNEPNYSGDSEKPNEPRFDDPKWYPSGHADFKEMARLLGRHFRRKQNSSLAKELIYYRARLRDPEVRNDPQRLAAVREIIKVYKLAVLAEKPGGTQEPMTHKDFAEIEKLLQEEEGEK